MLEFNFGETHPVYENLYQLVCQGHIRRQEWHEALQAMRTSCACVVRALGLNHPDSGKAFLHLAELVHRMDKKSQAIVYYLKAFHIYEAAHSGKDQSQVAHIAHQIALLKYETSDFRDLGTYLDVALAYFFTREYAHKQRILDLLIIKCEIVHNTPE